MSAIPLPSKKVEVPEWRALYLRALFEKDRSCMPSRILSARKALLRRERELFNAGSDMTEKSIVNSALHALDALRQCLSQR